MKTVKVKNRSNLYTCCLLAALIIVLVTMELTMKSTSMLFTVLKKD